MIIEGYFFLFLIETIRFDSHLNRLVGMISPSCRDGLCEGYITSFIQN